MANRGNEFGTFGDVTTATGWYTALAGENSATDEEILPVMVEGVQLRKLAKKCFSSACTNELELESGLNKVPKSKGDSMSQGFVHALFLCVILCISLLGFLSLYSASSSVSTGSSVALTATSIGIQSNKTVGNKDRSLVEQDSTNQYVVIPLRTRRTSTSYSNGLSQDQSMTSATKFVSVVPSAETAKTLQAKKAKKAILGSTKVAESHTFSNKDVPCKEISDMAVILRNVRNMEYIATIKIGDTTKTKTAEDTVDYSPQPFRVIVDTGSSDLWVPSNICGTPCNGHHLYNSDTTRCSECEAFNIKYGEGKVAGYYATDDVTIGESLVVKKVLFGVATEVSQFDEYQNVTDEWDGILGVGWPGLASGPAVPLITTMIQRKLLSQPMFSLQLGDKNDGEMLLGGYDETKFDGSLQWMPIENSENPTFWSVPVEYMGIAITLHNFAFDLSWSTDATGFVIDSGTSYFTGPSEDVAALAEVIGATPADWGQPLSEGRYFIECNRTSTMPNFVFTVPSSDPAKPITFVIEPTDYVVTPEKNIFDDEAICVFAFLPLDFPSAQQWIMGDIFMRNYYTVFDFEEKRIGFAKVKRNA